MKNSFTAHSSDMCCWYTRFLGMMCIVALLTVSSAFSIPILNLRSTYNFTILAGAAITGIPPVSVTGDVGLSPAAGSYITGFDGSNVSGTLYVVDASGPVGSVIDATLLQTAKSDLTTAYNDAAGRTPVPTGSFLNPGAGNIGGMDLAPGLYKFTSDAAITGANVTFTGNSTDVWIFQIASSLNVGSDIHIILAGGAQASNIFWQVGTSATLGTYSVFKGSILADQSISLGTGAAMDGRALAFSGAVTMASSVTTNWPIIMMPIFSVNLSQLSFGSVNSGASKMDSVTVTNTGNADLIISTITSSNARFNITPSNGTITPGGTQKYYITFAPLIDGLQRDTIIFNHNAAKPKDTITATGTGVSPLFSATPTNINFGNVRNGTTKMDSVTITNTGTANLIIGSVTSSNTRYTITPSNGTIIPGGTQKYYITFAPLVDGLQNGNIIFNHNAAKPKDTITVTGTGVFPSFSATPTNINFGNVRNGTTKMDSVTITNTGTSDLIIGSVTSSNPRFTVTPTTGTIIAGGTQKYYITFAPLVDGLQNGNIVFNHNGATPTNTITVSGTGVSPLFSATPTNINFGNVRNGTTKMDSVTITNTGTSDLIIGNVTISNPRFTVTPTTGTIIAGGTQKYYITFAPLVDGLQNGNIVFNHNGATPTNTITVSGTGVSPLFVATPTNINFGNVRNGTTKMDSVTITNTGTSDLIIGSVTSSNPRFTVTPTTGTIIPSGTQKYYITFAPLVDGLQNGNIVFNHNGATPTNTITVSGTGVSPLFSATPTNINFGNVRNGTTRMDSVTITNTGTSDLIIGSVTSSNLRFTVTPTTGTIIPGGTQKYYITFSPLVDGLQNGSIVFNHNAATPTNTITVSGTGVSPLFVVNPININFGNVRNGTSKIDSVTITNTGTSDLIISNVTSSNPRFTVTPTTGTIIPGGTQKYYITFAPLVDGLQNGNIVFNHNAATPTNTITVSGTGVSPLFVANPTNINFGNVRNGTTKMDSVTITNTGTSDLIISNVISSNPRFTVTPTTGTIIPGGTQKYYITFSPLVNGLQNGTIVFNHNAATPIDNIMVSGTGVSPGISIYPRFLDFGIVRSGSSKKDSVTVTNTGTIDLIISSVTINNGLFSVSPASGVIPPGGSQKFYITFAPNEDRYRDAYVIFTHNGDSRTDTVYVTGTGASPKFSAVPQFINFRNVQVGLTKTDSIIVTNMGMADLIISNAVGYNARFRVSPTNGTIKPGKSQTYYITFAPLADGEQIGNIIFYHNAPNSYDIIDVGGTGVSPRFSATPQNIDFGNVQIRTTLMKTVSVKNTGTMDLIISDITPSDSHYTITPVSGTIAPGMSKTFFLTFAPSEIGQVNAAIVFRYNLIGNELITVTATGNGIDTLSLISIQAARDLPLGTEFIIQGIVTRTLGSFTRIQDSTGGLTILQESGLFFDEVQNSSIQMSDLVRIRGRISEVSFLKVINGNDLINHQRISRSNILPIPVKVTLAELAANGEKYESRLIILDDMTVAGEGNLVFRQAKTYQVTDVSDLSNTVAIYIGNSADTYLDGMPFIGRLVTFEGVLSQSGMCSTCGYQLTPVLPNDLRNIPSGVSDAATGSLYSLSGNYPNPFNSSTTIQYTLGNAEFVSLKVIDMLGKEVTTLVYEFQNAGTYNVIFNTAGNSVLLGSDAYFYRLEAGSFVSTKQMILAK